MKLSVDMRLSGEETESVQAILDARGQLAIDGSFLRVEDHGAGSTRFAKSAEARRLSEIYVDSSISHHWGMLLFRLVRVLRPHRVLELGTNLGVSGSYIQAALDLNEQEGKLTTIDGDPKLVQIARQTVGSVSQSAVDFVVGRFQEVLSPTLDRLGSVDLAFVDGHHEEEPTYGYYKMIKPYMAADGVVVVDDIGFWTAPVRRAWKRILAEETKSLHLDLGRMGILCVGESPRTL
jgi:predicted O-methyltransferase YrrM